MKILIAYDGSKCSDTALDDLSKAGLPDTTEALVMAVAEVWLPPSGGEVDSDGGTGIHLDRHSEEIIAKRLEQNRQRVDAAQALAEKARDRLHLAWPSWRVEACGTYGSPAWEILTRAREIEADLIIVGSHGRKAISRFFLGSISQKILTEAGCSVRVARERAESSSGSLRLIIGFDGSQGSHAAVKAVAARKWPEHTEVQLVAATVPFVASVIGQFLPLVEDAADDVNESERKWLKELAESELRALRSKGLSANLYLRDGNPKDVLVDEGERWNADCIFVGANVSGSRLERFLLGTTPAAVAARSHCSVEVIRSQG